MCACLFLELNLLPMQKTHIAIASLASDATRIEESLYNSTLRD